MSEVSFNFVISAFIILSTILSVIMLQRTKLMGELIMMGSQMLVEFVKFFATFGLFLLITLFVGVVLKDKFRVVPNTHFEFTLDIFGAFNGIARFELFTEPVG